MVQGVTTYHTGLNTAGTEAGNGTPNDEPDRVGRRAANSRSDLEQDQSRQEHGLDGEECVQLAKDEQKGAVGQQVGGSVPANVAGRGKVVCDLGDGRRDD